LKQSGLLPGQNDVGITQIQKGVLHESAKYSLLAEKKKKSLNGLGTSTSIRNLRRSKFSTAIGDCGESLVYEYLQSSLEADGAHSFRWNARERETPGWDMEYKNKNNVLQAIEVKSTTGSRFPSIEITANEWEAASRLRENYHLALVAKTLSDEPLIEFVNDPYGLFEEGTLTAKPTTYQIERMEK